jgi:hypothetical protein
MTLLDNIRSRLAWLHHASKSVLSYNKNLMKCHLITCYLTTRYLTTYVKKHHKIDVIRQSKMWQHNVDNMLLDNVMFSDNPMLMLSFFSFPRKLHTNSLHCKLNGHCFPHIWSFVCSVSSKSEKMFLKKYRLFHAP